MHHARPMTPIGNLMENGTRAARCSRNEHCTGKDCEKSGLQKRPGSPQVQRTTPVYLRNLHVSTDKFPLCIARNRHGWTGENTNLVHINSVRKNMPTQRNMKIAEIWSTDCDTAETTRPATRARGKIPESLERTSHGVVGTLQSLSWCRIKTKKNDLQQMRLALIHPTVPRNATNSLPEPRRECASVKKHIGRMIGEISALGNPRGIFIETNP